MTQPKTPWEKKEVITQLAIPDGGRLKHPAEGYLFQPKSLDRCSNRSVACQCPRPTCRSEPCPPSVRLVSVAPDFGLRFRMERAGCGSYPEPAGHNSGMALPVDGVTERQRPNGLGLQIRQLTHVYQSLCRCCRASRCRLVVPVAPDFGLRFRMERAGCGSCPEPAGHNSGMALPVGEGPERRKPNELGRRIRSLTHAYQSLVSPSPSRVMPSHSHSPTGQGVVARRSCPKPAGHNSGMALPIGGGPERRKPNELGRRIQQLMRSRVAVGRSPGEVAATQVVPRSYRS